VYVAIASYCEKRHAYRDRCEIRHGPNRETKNNNNISEVIYYLNGGAGEDDDEELRLDVVGFEGTTDAIG
jgi:adenine specific DNA methylase Mod